MANTAGSALRQSTPMWMPIWWRTCPRPTIAAGSRNNGGVAPLDGGDAGVGLGQAIELDLAVDGQGGVASTLVTLDPALPVIPRSQAQLAAARATTSRRNTREIDGS